MTARSLGRARSSRAGPAKSRVEASANSVISRSTIAEAPIGLIAWISR
ncbi:hypothetical protein [Sphingomonas wittichii]